MKEHARQDQEGLGGACSPVRVPTCREGLAGNNTLRSEYSSPAVTNGGEGGKEYANQDRRSLGSACPPVGAPPRLGGLAGGNPVVPLTPLLASGEKGARKHDQNGNGHSPGPAVSNGEEGAKERVRRNHKGSGRTRSSAGASPQHGGPAEGPLEIPVTSLLASGGKGARDLEPLEINPKPAPAVSNGGEEAEEHVHLDQEGLGGTRSPVRAPAGLAGESSSLLTIPLHAVDNGGEEAEEHSGRSHRGPDAPCLPVREPQEALAGRDTHACARSPPAVSNGEEEVRERASQDHEGLGRTRSLARVPPSEGLAGYDPGTPPPVALLPLTVAGRLRKVSIGDMKEPMRHARRFECPSRVSPAVISMATALSLT